MSEAIINKEELKKVFADNVRKLYRKTVEQASNEELYEAAVYSVRDIISDKWMKTHNQYYEKDDYLHRHIVRSLLRIHRKSGQNRPDR